MWMTFRQILASFVLTALLTGPTLAQETPGHAPASSSKHAVVPWAFSLTTSGYIVPGDQSFVSPDFSADRATLHLEARYNSEALQTGSFWAGYNFSAGKKLVLNLTPMAGAVFGKMNGVAPGCAVTLTREKLQGFVSAEYVFDLQNRSLNYFYTWNQITYSPISWLQVGLVSQRTRAYTTGLGVDRGVLVGFTYKKVNLTTNIFNFGWTTPTEVLSLGVNF